MEYSYVITPLIGQVSGLPSTPFKYLHDKKFCGNGVLDE